MLILWLTLIGLALTNIITVRMLLKLERLVVPPDVWQLCLTDLYYAPREWVIQALDGFSNQVELLNNRSAQLLRDFHDWHPTAEDVEARRILEEFRALPADQRAQITKLFDDMAASMAAKGGR